jgi:hypothetical protein
VKSLADKWKSLVAWVRSRPPRTLLFFLLIESFVFLLLIVALLWVVFARE